MKKIIFILLVGIFMFSCGKETKVQNENKELYIYNWDGYISEEILDQFTKETGIKVIQDLFTSNEEMYKNITKKVKPRPYDIIVPTQDHLSILIEAGLLQKIDLKKINTYENIEKRVIDKLKISDPTSEYGVPLAMGVTGIIVNESYVKDYPKNFSIFEMENLKGKMVMLNDMREVMTAALTTLGYKQDTINPKELEAATKLILKWKKNLIGFKSKDFGLEFSVENYYVAQGYSDDFFEFLEDETKPNIKFIIPERGATAFIDSFVILKESENVEEAHKFIEFIHRPDIYAKIDENAIGESINNAIEKDPNKKLVYKISDLDRLEVIENIGMALDFQKKYWERIIAKK